MELSIKEKTPLSLGVGYRHDLFAVIIPRGTVYPCKVNALFLPLTQRDVVM